MVSTPTNRTRTLAAAAVVLLLIGSAAAVAQTSQDDEHPSDASSAGTAALTVHVTEPTSNTSGGSTGVQPAPNATVLVYEIERSENGRYHAHKAGEGVTGEDGTLRFELEPGYYVVGAGKDDARDHTRLYLDGDERVHLHLAERDRPHHANDRPNERPSEKPHDRPHDRPHESARNATLIVSVIQHSDERRAQPVPGANVTVYDLDRDRSQDHDQDRDADDPEPVARGQTNEDGHVRFELPRGTYGLRATDGDAAGHAKVHLDQVREHVRIHLGANDEPREPPRDRPHGVALGILALLHGEDGRAPASDAQLAIERVHRNPSPRADGPRLDPVERGQTDEKGTYSTVLPPGIYRVTITHEEGHAARELVHLDEDTWERVGLHPSDGPTIQG